MKFHSFVPSSSPSPFQACSCFTLPKINPFQECHWTRTAIAFDLVHTLEERSQLSLATLNSQSTQTSPLQTRVFLQRQQQDLGQVQLERVYCKPVIFLLFFLRQGLAKYPRLASDSGAEGTAQGQNTSLACLSPGFNPQHNNKTPKNKTKTKPILNFSFTQLSVSLSFRAVSHSGWFSFLGGLRTAFKKVDIVFKKRKRGF